MKLVVEYHQEIHMDLCNKSSNGHFVREGRLVARVDSHTPENPRLVFRIEENHAVDFGNGNGYSDSWVTLGQKTWSIFSMGQKVHPDLPDSIPFREFAITLKLLSGNPSAQAEGLLHSYFWELEVIPAFESGESWIKEAMPRWFDSLMKLVWSSRKHVIQEVMDS